MKLKSRLNSGNAYDYSVQNLGLSFVIQKYRNYNIHNVILSVILYEPETWSLTLME
jgi:hypothetical protein